MAIELAFLIKDLEPSEGHEDTVGIIAKVDRRNFSLEALLERIKDAFGNPLLQDGYGSGYDVNLSTGVEEVNGVLVGCVYLTDNGHRNIRDVGVAVLDRSDWSGTIATPAAVALYINQMKDFDCVNPTGEWKGFFNNEV
jgi:hypothetical protein